MRSFAVLPLILAAAFAGQDQTQSQLRRRNQQAETPVYSDEQGRWIMPAPTVQVDFNVDPDFQPSFGDEDFMTELVVVTPEPPIAPPPMTADETEEEEIAEEEEDFEAAGEEEVGRPEPPVVQVDFDGFSEEPSGVPSDAPSLVPSNAPSMMPSDVVSDAPSDSPSAVPSYSFFSPV